MTSRDRVKEEGILKIADQMRNEIVDFFKGIMRFRTENPPPASMPLVKGIWEEELKCEEFIASKLKSIGCTIYTWELPLNHRDLVGTLRVSGGGRSLILNGHIDVQRAGDPSAWKFDPWKAESHNGKIYGRGAADMKGGVASMIMALDVLKKAGCRLRGDVTVQIIPDEELEHHGTQECIRRGYTADAVLVTEPSSLDVQFAEMGVHFFRIEVWGLQSHSGSRYKAIHPGGGVVNANAIEKGIKIVEALRELEQQWAVMKSFPLLPAGSNTIMPGVMLAAPGGGGNGKLNRATDYNPGTTPDYCSIEFAMMWYPKEDLEQLKREITDHVNKVCSADPWLREHPPVFSWGIYRVDWPSSFSPEEHPFVETLKKAQAAAQGYTRVSGFPLGSDLTWYAQKGVPGAIYGPGGAAQAHNTDEFIAEDELVSATKTIALTVLNWCG